LAQAVSAPGIETASRARALPTLSERCRACSHSPTRGCARGCCARGAPAHHHRAGLLERGLRPEGRRAAAPSGPLCTAAPAASAAETMSRRASRTRPAAHTRLRRLAGPPPLRPGRRAARREQPPRDGHAVSPAPRWTRRTSPRRRPAHRCARPRGRRVRATPVRSGPQSRQRRRGQLSGRWRGPCRRSAGRRHRSAAGRAPRWRPCQARSRRRPRRAPRAQRELERPSDACPRRLRSCSATWHR